MGEGGRGSVGGRRRAGKMEEGVGASLGKSPLGFLAPPIGVKQDPKEGLALHRYERLSIEAKWHTGEVEAL